MATFRYVVCDVFTDVPFAGNQLAVFTDARDIPEERLLELAREINYSETVFVYPAAGDGHVRIRIFTPGREIPFAGHPVLGAAFVLAYPLQLNELHIETGAGTVPVRLERDGDRLAFGWMSQPVPKAIAFPEPEPLLAALGVAGSLLPIELYDNGIGHAYVQLPDEAAVAAVQPDHRALERFPHVGTSCFAGSGDRWTTRMFAPGVGVPEDPATGSAAGPLCVHLLRHGLVESGREIVISQGAGLGRPSTLHARVVGTPGAIELVEVGGCAITVARGEFRL